MRPAAKLSRKIANPHHAHLVAILLPEQSHGVISIDRLVDRNVSNGLDDLIAQHFLINDVFNILQLFVFHRGKVRKIKPQMIRRHQRPRLLHMLPQNLAQPGMKQMRSRVIAHSRLPNVSIHDSIDSVANAQRLFSNNLMRPHPLNRRIASRNVGDNGVVIVRIEPSPVTNLPAGFRIERRVIENDFAGFASLEFPRALPIVNDSQHLAAVRASLSIPFKDRFRKLLISRIRGLLGRAFPRGASASLLLLHRAIKASLVERRRPGLARHPA